MDSIHYIEQKKGIKMVHINVRSLFGKLDQVRNDFSCMDVIVISETWLNPSIPDSAIDFPGFTLIRRDRTLPSGKKGGGLCIYVKSRYKIDLLDDVFNMTTKDFETIGIKIKHPMIKPFNILGVYRLPSGIQRLLVEHLDKYLPDIIGPRKETFILGDFNMDYTCNKSKRKFGINRLESKFNFQQLINAFTRSTQNTNTIIDWILTDSTAVTESGTLNVNMSDHLPVYMVRKKNRNKIEKHSTTGPSYIHYDKDEFCRLIAQQNWNPFDETEDVSIMWNLFEENMNKTLDIRCPVRKITVSDTKPDWLSNEIILLMRKRDKAYKKARRTGNVVNWRKATFLRNRVDMFIKQYKKRKIIYNLEMYENNPSKFWKELRQVVPEEKQPEMFSLMSEENGELYEGVALCNHINHYFSQIGVKLAETIMTKYDGQSLRSLTPTVLNMDSDSITNKDFTIIDLQKALKLININKSSAVKDIRSQIIIDAFTFFPEKILKIYNTSIKTSTFPESWKKSIVVPLPKINNPKFAADMRPISLIPLPGKILEHLISIRLKMYLDENDILTPVQHGFRKGHSTITSITTLLHKIFVNTNNRKDSYLVYLDLKKAFDTVSHEILINKLGNIGLDHNTVKWFTSYLENRRQYVKFNNEVSAVENILYGVPQGSVLGPTLFSIYINDLADLLGTDGVLLYADDTVIYNTDPRTIQMLNKINIWCDENLLTINCKKSQWMKTNLVSKTVVDAVLCLGTTRLDKVKEYLGLVMDCNLSFKTHRETLQNRVNHKLLFFKKIRKYINVNAASTIYKSTILPVIEYADFVYDFNIKYNNKKLQILQNQGLYIIFNEHTLPYMNKSSTEALHRKAKLYRLIHRRKLHLLAYAFLLTKENARLNNRNIRTRNHGAILFRIEKPEHYKGYNDPVYRAMFEWNNLNVEVRNAETKPHLLSLLKRQIDYPYKKIL